MSSEWPHYQAVIDASRRDSEPSSGSPELLKIRVEEAVYSGLTVMSKIGEATSYNGSILLTSLEGKDALATSYIGMIGFPDLFANLDDGGIATTFVVQHLDQIKDYLPLLQGNAFLQAGKILKVLQNKYQWETELPVHVIAGGLAVATILVLKDTVQRRGKPCPVLVYGLHSNGENRTEPAVLDGFTLRKPNFAERVRKLGGSVRRAILDLD